MNKDIKTEQLNSTEENQEVLAVEYISDNDFKTQGDGEQDISSNSQEKKDKFFDKKFFIFSSVLLAIVVIIGVINSVLTFMVVVSGSSMKPTFQGGEVLFVNKVVEPERSDIIIVKVMEKTINVGGGSTLQEVWIIKRLIALPGDTVEIKDGYVFVNGTQIKEDYVSKQGITEQLDWQTKTLGQDEYFYLGDNRGVGQSSDSRVSEKGACHREDILGVVTETAIKSKEFSGFIYKITSPFRKLVYRIRGN